MSRLVIVTYHYVRDLPNTPFPRIKGLITDDFRRQLDYLESRFEMASWDSVTAFLSGSYVPKRDMCYLTFDDGLRDHYQNVFPVLLDRRLSAGFYPITACLELGWVAAVHKNHFLMATLEFDDLFERFTRTLDEVAPTQALEPDPKVVRQVYRWDEPEVGTYKYYVNYGLPIEVRERVLGILFADVFGSEQAFASDLYMNWDQIVELAGTGMSVGGHSHRHRSYADLSPEDQRDDIASCHRALKGQLPGLDTLPFCYPYGKAPSLTAVTPGYVKDAGFSAAVTTMPGWNRPDTDPYLIHRVDTNDVEGL